MSSLNDLELLLFNIGTRETFGLNVFKIREVARTPEITSTPGMPSYYKGVLSLRGDILPVISLSEFMFNKPPKDELEPFIMIVEYNHHSFCFLLSNVNNIIRIPWNEVHSTDGLHQNGLPYVVSLTRLKDDLISIIDIESIIVNIFGEQSMPNIECSLNNKHVFFVDDSPMARKEITMVLDKMNVKYSSSENGLTALEMLYKIATTSEREGSKLTDSLSLILSDIEMPEMDGYSLVKAIKADSRFNGIPILLHSSLSTNANFDISNNVGADGYITKFDPENLYTTLLKYLKD